MSAVAHRHAEESLVEGEFAFTVQDFDKIAAILHEDSGIHLPHTKATLAYSRLAKRLRALQLRTFADYCRLIVSPEGQEERKVMLTSLTTNVTRFFREPHHFDDLRRAMIPDLARVARAGGKVRLWSAGCSTGQEPYSIALTLLSELRDAADLDVRILASDIDSIVVNRAREAIYDEEAVSAIPSDLRKWLERLPDGRWRMSEPVRNLISFRELNLFGAWPMRGQFQVIFCRNVAIYFEEPAQEQLWSRFAEALTPDGRLYIGHSERVGIPIFETCGLTAYRLKGTKR